MEDKRELSEEELTGVSAGVNAARVMPIIFAQGITAFLSTSYTPDEIKGRIIGREGRNDGSSGQDG